MRPRQSAKTQTSGEIQITTAFRPGVRLSVPGSKTRVSLPLEICVKDNGPGVPEDLMPHLFDPFVTTKHSGSGLGLALVAKIIGDHGGITPLKHAGIDGWFEKSFSVDRVRRFKPAPQVYHMVAEELDVPPAAICMVAAHVWDTIGAQSVGCSGALITRPGNAPLPVHRLPQPQAVAPELPALATQLIKLWR